GIGFTFDNFKPQPIFGVIQRTAKELGYIITDEEMFRTFNMGWGFGIIVDKNESDKAINTLEQDSVMPERIGEVTGKERIVEIHHQNKHLILK
ncbi:MAG TPA: AIR synthase-related protein, partial [Candidatus Deferrimicrobiaceae bacterium]|nr:AIR synthase-related protein [Candidatus Deferrimicrobiaceae bacterium]